MKVRVTNTTTGTEYGIFDLKELVKGLSNAVESGPIAMSMRYDLGRDELEFDHADIGCTCKNSTGTTTIACCNICGKPTEKFWIK